MCEPRQIALIVDEVFADYELEPARGQAAGQPLQADRLPGVQRWAACRSRLACRRPSSDGSPPAVPTRSWRKPRSSASSFSATPISRCRRRFRRRPPSCSRAGRRCATQIQRARRGQLPDAADARSPPAPACRCSPPKAAGTRCPGPVVATEEDLVVDLLTNDGVLVHPGYFFDFPRESFLVVSLLPPEAAFADGIGARSCGTSLARMSDHHERDVTGRRRAGLLIPLFSCPSTDQLGHRRHRRPRAVASWLAAAGQPRPAAAAAERNGAGPAVAVFGDQRDGHRSDLHPCRCVPEFVALGRRSER